MIKIVVGNRGYLTPNCTHRLQDTWQSRFWHVIESDTYEGFCNYLECALSNEDLAVLFLHFDVIKDDSNYKIVYYKLVL